LWPIPVHEITVIGSRCGPFTPALELLASGAIRARPLIAETLPLGAHAVAFAQAGTDLKVLLAP
jgi:threonine dehydrogenase-like Zn-dependent dehydrogenase